MSLFNNTQGGGTGGASASIFVTGLSEADTVTATKGSKTVKGKWVQKKNPAVVVPDGYTQLSHIESTGEQNINTEIPVKSGLVVDIDFQFTVLNNNDSQMLFFGGDGVNKNCIGVNNQLGSQIYFYHGNANTYTAYSDFLTRHNYKASDYQLYIDDVLALSRSQTTFSTSNTIMLFGGYDSGSFKWAAHGKCFGGSVSDTSGEYSRKYIPCKNPSGVVGLYDLVTNTFEGSATGVPFVAGEEVPQYFYYHEITIKDYGLWTVTATNGEDTTTQDVLVDAAIDYEIEMGYKLWLYREGDKCEVITGGWEYNKMTLWNGCNNGTATEGDGYIQLKSTPSVTDAVCNASPINKTDVTPLSKIFINVPDVYNGSTSCGSNMSLFTEKPLVSGSHIRRVDLKTTGLHEMDVSDLSGEFYIVVNAYGYRATATIQFDNIWLE